MRKNLLSCCCDVNVCLGMWWKKERLRHILHRNIYKSQVTHFTPSRQDCQELSGKDSHHACIFFREFLLFSDDWTGCGEIFKMSLNFLKSSQILIIF